MYKITIEKIEKVKSTGRSYEKLSDAGNKSDNGPIYGYVEYPEEKAISTEVLRQNVEDIDITKVIKAINDIE